MTELEQKKEMVNLARSLFERGYSVGGAGNLSVRLDEKRILVTPTGSSLGRLEADSLSVLDMEGNLLSGKKPSKESVFHLAMYHKNPACHAIVHLHSTYLTALSCLEGLNPDNAMKAFTPYYVMRVGKLPVIPYYRPGDTNIARELSERSLLSKAFLLANHGVVVTGTDLVDAVDNTEELEETAKLYFLLKGQQVRYLTDDEVKDLEKRGK
ncbi:3-oxo-tetronate 4-phosphate decarboxylase [Pasteurella multocida]|uniref:3-oxo-tetronate 4-phosphate decarboxylase n=1 Tax=Pasteurella multocida TaxID=747 RepID=UPI0002828ECC|nr:aldolase [Pasteurella multocida]ARB73984.1 aldolase [Pasteurella multocida]EJZ78128.1 Ribulose-5-phosphate 4-epimerase [Pasteurella multocida subsp. gallicida X73]OBP26963.1 class II aldolase [Pasteurella multocida subsp. multocida]HDR1325910.1 aldolase [Pasteurella multocida]HDR1326897.1 aldolase [Pasteurella multocida]